MADENHPEDNQEGGPDLVLNEALNILSDLAGMSEGSYGHEKTRIGVSCPAEPAEKTLIDEILQWLKTIL